MIRVFTSVAALVLCMVSLTASPQPVDSPYEKLKSYDYQNRTPADAISEMIKQANGDSQKLATIETRLDGILDDPAAAFGGKQEACRLLSIIGTGISVPSLAKMLTDDKLADIARYALERDPAPTAARALRLALATTTGKTQIGVINSLGDRADPAAPGVLKKYIVSPDADVAEAAITALGKIGDVNSIALLKKLPASNVAAGHALLRAAAQLAAAGAAPAALGIYDALANGGRPPVVRAEAMRGLSVLNSPHAAAIALAALRSDDPYLQEVAARVIGTIGTGAAVNPAMEIWPHLQPKTQIVLLTAFADRRDKSAIPMAFTAIDSKDDALRAAGMRSAALIGGPQALAHLIYILSHGNGDDKSVARDALASAPGSDAERLILDAAGKGDADTRSALMRVLADRPTDRAMAVLTDAAGDAEKSVAVQALQALGRVGKPAPFDSVIRVLVSTKSDDIRDAARDAAGAIAPKVENHGASQVFAVMDGATDAAKAALYPLLPEIGDDRALKELVESATAPEGALRRPALNALADGWPDARALPTLLTIAQTDSDKSVKVQALRGYLRILGQDDSMPPNSKVARVIKGIDAAARTEEKRQALSVLRDCRVQAAVDASAKLLDDPELFNDAANTIIYLAGKQRKNDKDQAAVTGVSTNAALDKIIQMSNDDGQKTAAQKVRGQ